MKKSFSCVIMNPPYDRSLHLDILEKVIQEAEEVVNISPIRWLQDPLVKYKKNSDFNKRQDSIVKHINELKVIDQTMTDKMFGIQFNAAIGIAKCDKNGGYKIKRNIAYETMLDKIIEKSKENIPNVVSYKDSNKNNFVPICLLAGHVKVSEYGANVSLRRERYKYFINNKCQCERFEGQTPEQCKSYNLKTFDTASIIEFDSEEETKNFYDYISLKAFDYFTKTTSMSGNLNIKYMPWVNDYSEPWTNERFCKYFGITGYISDSEAEPNSEWEQILKTMEKYK